MNLNISYDQNTLNSAPSQFFTAVNYVVNLLDSLFTNNVTVNIEVGYGLFPFNNTTVPPLGESQQNHVVFGNYAQVRQVLINEGAPGAGTLPSTSPLTGSLTFGSAQEKALGLIGASSTLDGWVGIASNATLSQNGDSWSFSPTATPSANQAYIVGTLEHEITEVMGRVSYLDSSREYGVMDLYRYAASGVRQTGTGGPSYFSINSGQTNLDTWNNARTAAGDLGDWAASAGADAFLNQSPDGQINGITQIDITLMAAIGWTSAPHVTPVVNVQDVSVAENASIPAASLIASISNPSNDNITGYEFIDQGGGGGHFLLGNTVEPSGQLFQVSDLSTLQYVGGAAAGSETLGVAAFDATTASYTALSTLTATTTAPPPPANNDEWLLVNGHWSASVNPGSHPAGANVAGVGDFNGDGTSDILWYSASSGDVDEWLLSNGKWAGSVDLGAHPGSGWQIAGIGDFNGDHTSDVLWFNAASGATDIWQLSNGKWAGSVSPGSHPTGVQVAGIGDFNGDGTSDVLFFNTATGDVDEWKIVNGKWAGSVDIGTHPGTGWQVAGVGDFNHDGTSDVLWFNSGTGATDIWEMLNGHWAASVSPGAHPTGVQVAGVGDFNHDGTTDILWQNPATGDIDEWLLSNGKWTASVDFGAHPGAGWQVAGIGDFNHDGTSDVLWHNSLLG